MKYDLNLLPVFVALMEERSVTRAASRLGMTQAALSNALARLRLTLQDPLFIRERYGMRPTPKAELLAPSLVTALASMDAVVLGQQAFEPARADHLITIAPNSYVEFVLVPQLVARLSVVAPGVRRVRDDGLCRGDTPAPSPGRDRARAAVAASGRPVRRV